MKATNINARIDKAGKHNDRNFNVDNAGHIDKTRMKDNIYYTYNGDTQHSFAEVELEFYKNHFQDKVDAQNQRNIITGHPERNHTIEDYYHSNITRPEDKILQIGNIKEHASGEELWECAMAYKDRFNELYGDKCVILDMALHLDEATPHVHVRRVWMSEDENGELSVSQNKALEQLGISAPDVNKPIGKYNNAKMTFTQTDQRLFRDICIEKGFDIEHNPKKEVHLDTATFKQKQIDELDRKIKDLKEKEKEQIDGFISFFESNPFFSEVYANEIEIIKRKEKEEQYKMLFEIYEKEMNSRIHNYEETLIRNIAQLEGSKEVKKMTAFLKEKGLFEEYMTNSDTNKDEPIKEKEESEIPPTSYF